MIRLNCSNCGQKIKTDDKYAGKRIRCPNCKQPLQIPQVKGGTGPAKPAIIKFRCPNCSQKIGVSSDYAGKVVRCAKCKHRLRVPQPPGAAAQPKPQDDLAPLRVAPQQPASDEAGLAGLGDMSDLLQLEASAPSIEDPLQLSPLEEPAADSRVQDYESQFPTRPAYQTDREKPKKSILAPIVIVAVCIVGLVVGFVVIKGYVGKPVTTASRAGAALEDAQEFAEDYITLLADGDVDAAIEKLSPEVKVYTDKEQVEILAKKIGKSEIQKMEDGPKHYEEIYGDNLFYFWYDLIYEEGEQSVIVCVREVDTGFTVDGIAVQEPFGQAVAIGHRSFEQLAQRVMVSVARGVAAFLARIACVLIVVLSIVGLIQTIAMWIIFEKANQPGWAAIVPFYNMWVLAEVGDQSGWTGLGVCFGGAIPVVGPIVQIALWIIISMGVAKSFGRGVPFGIGLSFLPFIFYPILAFSRD